MSTSSAHSGSQQRVADDVKMVTANEFLLLMLSQLLLLRQSEGSRVLIPADTIDYCFEVAFEKLWDNRIQLGLLLCFSFFCNRLHGNSVMLHDALLSAKLRGLIDRDKQGYTISMSKERAQSYIDRSTIDRDFLSRLAASSFTDVLMTPKSS